MVLYLRTVLFRPETRVRARRKYGCSKGADLHLGSLREDGNLVWRFALRNTIPGVPYRPSDQVEKEVVPDHLELRREDFGDRAEEARNDHYNVEEQGLLDVEAHKAIKPLVAGEAGQPKEENEAEERYRVECADSGSDRGGQTAHKWDCVVYVEAVSEPIRGRKQVDE